MSNENKNTLPARPFALEYAEAKKKIFDTVNEASKKHGIPFYLLEDILSEISRQVKDCARVERDRAQKKYEQELAEYEQQQSGG